MLCKRLQGLYSFPPVVPERHGPPSVATRLQHRQLKGKTVELTLVKDGETKNKVKYSNPEIGTVYVPKEKAADLGDTVVMTLVTK